MSARAFRRARSFSCRLSRDKRSFVKPAFDQFVKPTARHADLVIPRGLDNVVAIDVVCTLIAQRLTLRSNDASRARTPGTTRCFRLCNGLDRLTPPSMQRRSPLARVCTLALQSTLSLCVHHVALQRRPRPPTASSCCRRTTSCARSSRVCSTPRRSATTLSRLPIVSFIWSASERDQSVFAPVDKRSIDPGARASVGARAASAARRRDADRVRAASLHSRLSRAHWRVCLLRVGAESRFTVAPCPRCAPPAGFRFRHSTDTCCRSFAPSL